MLKHCVFLKFRGDTTEAERRTVLGELGAFAVGLEGVLDYCSGPNHDFEQLSKGFTDGFIVTFADKAASDAYATNPDHKKIGAQLVSMCEGGVDGLMVVDLEI